MKLFQFIFSFAKSVAASRTAQIFFFIHLILLVTALIHKLTIHQTIQPVHFENEFLLYKILSVLNLPASVITGVLSLPFTLLFIHANAKINPAGSSPFIIVAYIGWQIQWALIGYGVEKLLITRKRAEYH